MRDGDIEREQDAVAAGQRGCAVGDCPLVARYVVCWGEHDGIYDVVVVVALCWWHAYATEDYAAHPDVSALRCLACHGPLRAYTETVSDEESGKVYEDMPFYECLVCRE